MYLNHHFVYRLHLHLIVLCIKDNNIRSFLKCFQHYFFLTMSKVLLLLLLLQVLNVEIIPLTERSTFSVDNFLNIVFFEMLRHTSFFLLREYVSYRKLILILLHKIISNLFECISGSIRTIVANYPMIRGFDTFMDDLWLLSYTLQMFLDFRFK